MSYEPTIWESREKITTQRLNKIEQGIADADILMYLYPSLVEDQDLFVEEPVVGEPVDEEQPSEEQYEEQQALRSAVLMEAYELNHTWKEISDAIDAGKIVLAKQLNGLISAVGVEIIQPVEEEGVYEYYVYMSDDTFSALEEDARPRCMEPSKDGGVPQEPVQEE